MASKKRSKPAPDLTTRILIQIGDGIDKTNERLDLTNERLDLTNERLDRLERRRTEDAVRVATELVAVATAVGQVRDLLRDQRVERGRLEDHERRIASLEKKTA
jgi:hypothetical protein